MRGQWFAVGAVGALLAVSNGARASERHFTFTQESNVLNPGALEVEPQTTARFGKAGFFFALDNRIELEAGIVEGVQAAVYANFKTTAEDVGAKRVNTFEWQGVSAEVKWKLLDATADPVGLALYFEPSLSNIEGELEGKVIVDKRFGDFLVATNLVVEQEAEWEEKDELAFATKLELDAGGAYFIVPQLSLGIEMVSASALGWGQDGSFTSALFAGPVVCWTAERFWISGTVLPQVGAPAGATVGALDLDDHERLSARVVLGVHL